ACLRGGAQIRALHPEGPRRGFHRGLPAGALSGWLAPRGTRAARGGHYLHRGHRRTALTRTRGRDPGALLQRALGTAVRPGDDPRTCRLPPAATPPAARALARVTDGAHARETPTKRHV